MLMALHSFVDLLTPHEDVPSLRLLLGAIATQPVLDVLLAAGLTWAAHSSVAIVLVIMSFAAQGTVPPEAAFALVLGANLGTAINPILEGGVGGDQVAKRLPWGNLLNRIVGVCVALVALPYMSPLIVTLEPNNARAVANFHTAFNIVLALVFFPFLGVYARGLRRLFPARPDQNDPSRPIYLDPVARDTPVVALGAAAREVLRMADVLEAMLTGLRDAFESASRRQIGVMKRMDDVLDKLNTAIKAYVLALDPEAMSEADLRRAREILAFATNIEQAGDIVDRNLLAVVSKLAKRGLVFSKSGQAELLAMIDRLISNVRSSASLFMTATSVRPACWRPRRRLSARSKPLRPMRISTAFVPAVSTPPRPVRSISMRCVTSRASTSTSWRPPPIPYWKAGASCCRAGCARIPDRGLLPSGRLSLTLARSP